MSEEADLLSGTALTVFRLHGQVFDLAESLARPAGLTAAWWQVLGAVLREPLPVASIARVMGMTRQGVQRIADLVVEKGLAEYVPNPAHRRAKLVRLTEAGYAAISAITPMHAEAAERLSAELGVETVREVLEGMEKLSAALARMGH
ncbi:MAG: MarR family transcriptional regulator [Nonomuraea sp.]|nr:MarR family transcriptional regulator [Nonomuraea sp.]